MSKRSCTIAVVRVDRAAQQDRQPADVRERQRAQPALGRVERRARRPSPARSTASCRRSARPARGAPVVPEVWTTTRVASRSCAARGARPARPSRRAARRRPRARFGEPRARPRTGAGRPARRPPRAAGTRGAATANVVARARARCATRSPARTPRPRSRRAARAPRSRSRRSVSVADRRAVGRARAARGSQESTSIGRQSSLPAHDAVRPGRPPGEFEDIRYETSAARRASRRSRSTAPRSATRSGPQTVDRALARASSWPARTPSVGVIVLTGEGPLAFCSGGDQRVRGDSGYMTDPAGSGVGRFHVTDLHVQIRRLPKPVVAMVAGLRGRRRPRPAPRLRPDDRRRQRALRPDRPAGRDRSTAASAPALLANLVGHQEGQGDLVPLPPVRRASRRWRWGSSTPSCRSTRLEEETVAWCDEMLALSPFALRLLKASFHAAEDGLAGHPAARPRRQPPLLRAPRRRARGARPTRPSARPTSRSSPRRGP